MDYEAFTARANGVFDDCSEMKRMLWNAQSVVGAVPNMVRKNERLEKEKAELKAENAALKVELDDWKGNAEGFEPDAYMRLPVDADGVPIRLGDKVWYVGINGEITKDDPLKVTGFVRVLGDLGTFIETQECPRKAIIPESLTHKQPEPPDSWEQLEDDSLLSVDEYRNLTGIDCNEGAYFAKQRDLIRRAKRLAGVNDD